MKRSIVFSLALLLVLAIPLEAAEVSASLDRDSAQVGDNVVLTVIATGAVRSVPELELSNLETDFDVYSMGQSTNVSIVNGKMTSETSRQFVLIPKRAGTYTIGPLSVRLGKDEMQTQPLRLTVSAGAPPPSPTPDSRTESGGTMGTEDLFVRASVDKA